jgi:hypothetical protein
MKQATTRGPTHSCRALQSRTTQLHSGLMLELRSIALGFFQPTFLALPTWRIHASPLRPLACLRTLITAGGKHRPLHSHTQHPQERNQNCAHATPNSQIRRERKPELCTRNTQFTNPKEHTHTHTHTHEHTRGGGPKWRVQERLGEWVLSRNCGCERDSRQVSTISDAGTRYALRLSQIQQYYSVDLSVSVFITYVEEGFFFSRIF